jgi:hypothetical protein
MFFINLYTSIDRFLIRTRVKYSEALKDNNFKIPPSFFFFFNLAEYFSVDRRTIVPILSNFRHFSMLLQFILKISKLSFYCNCSKSKKMCSCPIFFCDPLEDKINRIQVSRLRFSSLISRLFSKGFL